MRDPRLSRRDLSLGAALLLIGCAGSDPWSAKDANESPAMDVPPLGSGDRRSFVASYARAQQATRKALTALGYRIAHADEGELGSYYLFGKPSGWFATTDSGRIFLQPSGNAPVLAAINWQDRDTRLAVVPMDAAAQAHFEQMSRRVFDAIAAAL